VFKREGGDVQKAGKGNPWANKGKEREPVCRRVDGWLLSFDVS